ncbi:MAG: hypothetical protein ABIR62_09160 [Dokdonella sp.]
MSEPRAPNWNQRVQAAIADGRHPFCTQRTCAIPTLRASRISPMEALRDE